MDQLKDIFLEINSVESDCIEKTFNSKRREFGEINLIDHSLSSWLPFLNEYAKEDLITSRKEFALAQYCAASGLYRQAYSSLRTFLELGFASVYFSANELEYREWKNNRIDYHWSAGVLGDKGVLSSRFINAFNPKLRSASKRYADSVGDVYRTCSEFVHAKAAFTSLLPENIVYSEKNIDDWCKRALDAGKGLLFALLVRYGEGIISEIYSVQRHNRNQEPILDAVLDDIQHYFSHIPEVREMIGVASDQ
ncbi:hypothetical protein [Corynebacterium amycolatum]|uniref:hypothetical protein n=1 Tax=Corynebacterium amycolatum TaxID=43765 RepID=UPI00117A74A6|nr:hypothetical protein [Corynebacterium amycolatum]MDK7315457.1 hypothetical protein [Corynebacterium amycolatum]